MEREEQKNAVDGVWLSGPPLPPWLAAWLVTGSDPCISSRAGLLSLSTSDIWGQYSFAGGGVLSCVL